MINYGHITHADSHPIAFAKAREKAKADGLRGAFGRTARKAFIILTQQHAASVASVRQYMRVLTGSNRPPTPTTRPETPVNPWILKLRAKREKALATKAAALTNILPT